METIRIYKGDSYPIINMTLVDEDSGEPGDPESRDPVDLSGATVSVRVDWRKPGETDVIATVSATKVSNGTHGEVLLSLPGAVYDTVGVYDGQVVVERDGKTETVHGYIRVKTLERGR